MEELAYAGPVEGHSCLVYATEEERLSVVLPFLRGGLASGERLLYIADAEGLEGTESWLRTNGVFADHEHGRTTSQVRVLRARDVFFQADVFSLEQATETLEAEAERAAREGCAGLRVASEMAWASKAVVPAEMLIRWETRVGEVVARRQASALCQYPAECLPAELLLRVLQVHPTVFLGAQTYGTTALPATADSRQAHSRRGEPVLSVGSLRTQVRYRLGLEKALAQAAELLISQENPDLTEVLGTIGRAAEASRAHLWECRDGGRVWSNTHEWCSAGAKPLIGERRRVDAAAFPWWKARLEAGESILVPVVEAFPPEASAEQHLAKACGVRSMLTVPIHSRQHELVGFTGLHDTVRSDRRRVADDAWALRVLAGMIAAHWDRVRATADARRAAERFRLLTEHSRDPFLVLGADRVVSYVSPAITEALGYAPEELVGKTVEPLIHPRDIQRLLREFELCLGRADSYHVTENRVRHKNGSWRVFRIGISNLMQSPPVSGMVIHAHDVTAVRRLEGEVLTIGTRERQDLRRDLHDGLGGHFTALSIRSATLARKLSDSVAIAPVEVAEIARLIEEARCAARAISEAVCPVPARPDGLMAGLRQLASTTQDMSGTPVRFDCPHPVLVPDTSVALQAYRIAQEATNNAVRHSGAAAIVLSLHDSGEAVTLSVQDNGVGLKETSAGGTGIGLRLMRYRAHLLHASLHIGRAPEGGTIVTLTFDPRMTEATDPDGNTDNR